jgi:hypothetical protein
LTTPACACGSPRTVRHGSVPGHRYRLADGKAEKVGEAGSRFLCRGCGRTFTRRTFEAEAEERILRDRAAELAFRLGRHGAAGALGLHGSVLDNMLDRWQSDREVDVADAAPDFLAVERVALGKGGGILVADVDRETLVEVVADAEALAGWLAVPGRLPALRVCVPLDPEIAASVRLGLPEAEVLVAPATVLRAIRSALAAGLRILRRIPGMRRRNAFPSTARFLRSAESPDAMPEGWPVEVVALRGAGRIAREIAGSADAELGAGLWREFELSATEPCAQPLARLMATWKGAILSGLDHRFVDRVAGVIDRIRRVAPLRRPSLVLRDFRAFVLLRDCERAAFPSGVGRYGGPSLPHGRPLAGIADILGREGPRD